MHCVKLLDSVSVLAGEINFSVWPPCYVDFSVASVQRSFAVHRCVATTECLGAVLPW